MKFEVIRFEGATLPVDREPIIVIDGTGTLILSRNDTMLDIGSGVKRWSFRNLTVQGCLGTTNRIGRFLVFAKAAWRFSK